MSSKKYTLVAWTENGEVRMVPSLIHVASKPYRDRIERVESRWEEVNDEIGWLLAQSRAHEDFARFLLRVGHPRKAYVEFENAARVCIWCSDTLWLQGESCDFPALPLLYRFLAMHRECVRLAAKDRFLTLAYEGSELESDYLFFTRDDRETERIFDACFESRKAWRFGKGN